MPKGPLFFDPTSLEFLADPYPTYERLRRIDPVHRSPLGFCFATRYDDINFILRDKRLGKDFVRRLSRRAGAQILDEPVYRSMRHWMLEQDTPDHTRLRSLVVQAFNARCVEDMRPRIQRTVDRLIDHLSTRSRGDLIADFAFRLPVMVICDMLGIPEGHQPMFLAGARGHGQFLDPGIPSRSNLEAANRSHSAAEAYFQRLVRWRRREPGADLVSQLVYAEEHGSKLSNEELVANLILIFGAGHETTTNLIGNGLLALFRNPEQLALVKENHALLPNVVDECLRYDSSVHTALRVALTDVDVGGTLIRQGEVVIGLLAAGNRDPAVYSQPELLDVTRESIRPLSFGGGAHFCLGAQLARIEAEIAIATVFRRLARLRPDHVDALEWRPMFVLRGLKELPATW